MKRKILGLFMLILIGAMVSMHGMMSRATLAGSRLSQRAMQLSKQPWSQRVVFNKPVSISRRIFDQEEQKKTDTSSLTMRDRLTTLWNNVRDYVSSLNISNKLAFVPEDHKNNKAPRNKIDLLLQLEELAQLSWGEEYSIKQNYKYEVQNGNSLQAEAWLFGRRYSDAIQRAHTLEDIELLYEAAVIWICLRMKSGLSNTLNDVKTEFARIKIKEEDIVDLYDEKSMPLVRIYLSDKRSNLYNWFKRWFNAYKKKNLININNREQQARE